jgi:hypothetical protein
VIVGNPNPERLLALPVLQEGNGKDIGQGPGREEDSWGESAMLELHGVVLSRAAGFPTAKQFYCA